MVVFSCCHLERRFFDDSFRSVSSFSRRTRRSLLVSLVSFLSVSRSISSWWMRRSTLSSLVGIESIFMWSFEVVLSTRSMVLFGRNWLEIYCAESVAVVTSVESWMWMLWCIS